MTVFQQVLIKKYNTFLLFLKVEINRLYEKNG